MYEFVIIETGATPKAVLKHLSRAHKKAWQAVARWWMAKIRPKHFTVAGGREYHYEPREGEAGRRKGKPYSQTYTGRKLIEHGHTNPMMLTGISRVATSGASLTGTGKGIRIRMKPGNILRNLKTRYKRSAEMTAVSRKDAKVLTRLFARTRRRELAKLKDKEVTTIK